MGPSAEKDYRRIIVDYPLTSRAPDALLKLGQLELTRGDRAAAEGHFKRIISDYESSSVYAEANYWLARSYFDMNKTKSACKVNAEALAKVNPSNIELKNQIDFQNQQCRGLAVTEDTATVADTGVEKAEKPRRRKKPKRRRRRKKCRSLMKITMKATWRWCQPTPMWRIRASRTITCRHGIPLWSR
jgi:tetratricopeptide (TPR) repeat protein